MKTKYSHYIFDLDGTLIDSKRDIANATNATIRHMGGTELPDKHIYEFVGRGVRDLVRQAVAKVPGASVDEALAFFNSYYTDHCLDFTVLFPGVRETLQALRAAGADLAVFTNKPQQFSDATLLGLGIADWFVVAKGGESGHPHKPDPVTTRFVLQAMAADPHMTLMVGDSVVDYDTARLVGMDCALMLYGFSEREEIQALGKRGAIVCEQFSDIFSM